MKKFLPVFSKTILMAAVVLLTVSGCKKDPLDSKPVACIDAVPATGQIGTAINFNSSCTEGAVSLVWSFGDGDVSTAANVAHTYDAAGTYTVTLTVTNTHGTSTVTKTIAITDPRALFVGVYSATDNPGNLTYNGNIGNLTAANAVYLYVSFANYFFSNVINATVSGNTITIPSQQPDSDGYFVQGTGTITGSGSNAVLTWTYSITFSGTTTNYTGTWIKF